MGPRRRHRTLVLSLGAILGLVQAYVLPVRRNRGPEGRWWEPLRQRASRLLGRRFDEGAGPRSITREEYAGTLPVSVPVAEELLYQRGFVRNPLARLKQRDGTPESGSWVARESPLATRQLHCMLFEVDGGTAVYAHEEFSSVNPLYAPAHFAGIDQRNRAGVERARDRLPLEAPPGERSD
ncbi:MAG: hypothetical protein V5A55_09730 [Halovenus sp.]